MTLFGRRSNTNDCAVTFRVPLLLGACCMVACLAAFRAEADEPAADPVRAAFVVADADGSRTLTLEEFLTTAESPDVARRDFGLFDFDRDSLLTVEEFSTIPGHVRGAQRGAIPDSFEHLLDATLEAMDETLKKVLPPNSDTIPADVFLQYVAASVSPNGQILGPGFILGRGAANRLPDADLLRLVDTTQNGEVERREARRFMEILLSIRTTAGERLRTADGRVVDLAEFQFLDANHNQQLSPAEFNVAADQFAALDLDRNERITLDEFTGADGPGWFDPIVEFRDADTNLNGLLESDEARAATDKLPDMLVAPCFRAFDENGDGNLSLSEYRMSMLGNPVSCWERLPLDTNEDFSLTLDEFNFGSFDQKYAQYEGGLLRLLYFHRFDADGDGKLLEDEFPFKTRPPGTMKLLAADGSALLPLYTNAEYPHCGSPAVSPDGKTIAFDGRRAGEPLSKQRILMIDRDGGRFRDVCEGLMPTWSPDGTQFTCSRYEPRHGVWIIDADGSNARWVAEGWGAQWSPDGKTIAYTNNRGVWAYDVATEESREILSSDEHPYELIYWNMSWSPDSRRLTFKGRKERGNDLASISMVGDDPDLHVHLSTDVRIEPDFAWSLDGKRIVFCMDSPDHPNDLLYEIDPTTDDPPRLVKGIDQSMFHNDCCFTPDGKWIVFAATESVERGL